MKLRNSVIDKISEKEIIGMNKKELRKYQKEIINSWCQNTRGHQMEKEVSVIGQRNMEIEIGGIVFEADAFAANTKMLTEIKSKFGSKVIAIENALFKTFLIYHIQRLLNKRKIKSFTVVGINSKITKKYGMDYTEITFNVNDLKSGKLPKQRGVDVENIFLYAETLANEKIDKYKKIIEIVKGDKNEYKI